MRATRRLIDAALVALLGAALPSAFGGWQGEADDNAFQIIGENSATATSGGGAADAVVAFVRSAQCPNPALGTL
ncbi:MAG: hypothetical protein ACOH2F_12990, partial [Cellulomonas sp.]